MQNQTRSRRSGYDSSAVGGREKLEEIGEVLDGQYNLKVPGVTVIPGWKITATVEKKQSNIASEEGYIERFDCALAETPLVVRGRKPGDSFRPLGMEGSKSLKDFMIDMKVPRNRRDAIPLVCCAEHIIWVVGYRIDHRARVKPDDAQWLQIRFERTDRKGV